VEEFAAEVNPKPTPATDRVVAASSETVERNHFIIQIGAFKGSPKDKSKWFDQSTKQKSTDGINRYVLGAFESSGEAQSLLKEIQREIPDAFIKIVAKETIKVADKPNAVVKTTKKPKAKTKEKDESSGWLFRLKIVQFEEHLEPAQVARLLRLGNEIPLTTMRSGKSTVYVSKTFPNLEAAKQAMDLCIERGFRSTELQIIND
jgi:cell division septation protein DedD